jgi:hypothetical protein
VVRRAVRAARMQRHAMTLAAIWVLIAVGGLLCGCAGNDPYRIACQALSERERLIDQHTWASNRSDNAGFDCDQYLAKSKSR